MVMVGVSKASHLPSFDHRLKSVSPILRTRDPDDQRGSGPVSPKTPLTKQGQPTTNLMPRDSRWYILPLLTSCMQSLDLLIG